MKTNIMIIMLFFAFINLKAQESLLNFQEDKILINGVSVNVGNTMLNGDIKQINKSWISFIKSQLDKNMKEDDGVLTLKETVINQITDKRGDLMVYIYNQDNLVSLNVAYKLGYDVYLNSRQYPDEYKKLEEFINQFIYYYYNDYFPTYIKDGSKDLKVLSKEKSNSEKSIKKAKKKNKKLAKKNKSLQKKVTKLDGKIAQAIDEPAKKDLLNSQKEYNQNIIEKNKTIDYNNGLIGAQEDIIKSLIPKIDELTKEIESAKLTLVEVRSKVKTSK